MTTGSGGASKACSYITPGGEPCPGDAVHGGFCYWHDASRIKTESDLETRLEQRAQTEVPMQGFALKSAALEGVNLVHDGSKQGYDLRYSDFYRADLQNAHLFHADLRHSSLMKADLRGANLHCSNLEGANLLGARFDDARLENVHWGHYLLQEQEAYQAKDRATRLDYFEQAEDIYRHLRRVLENQGLFEQAGYFFRREMVMRRYQMPFLSVPRVVSRVVDLFCGYGERPLRVILFSLFLILSFAVIFFLNGVNDGGQLLQLDTGKGFADNFYSFINAVYFSVVTFTTLGYGDITPTGLSRFFAATEAFMGSFTLALFVVVFVKKMTR